MASVPVILVSNVAPVNREAINFVEVFTPETVIRHKGEVIIKNAHIALLDPSETPDRQVIISALYLRNAGMTAVIGDPHRVPCDLIESIHSYMTEKHADGTSVQTELLIMEDAMHLCSSINVIVRAFERGNI